MNRTLLLLTLLCFAPATATAQTVSAKQVTEAALTRLLENITYDGRYFSIPYPDGDVPVHLGVCTDVVIRAYRKIGIDLQRLVHEDMRANFSLYPKRWALSRPDRNIDHRRVPNLATYFKRHGYSLKISNQATDYHPGDLVTWDLDPGRGELPHIGIVVPSPNRSDRPWIIHNIGSGPEKSDSLFHWKITGHFRFLPKIKSVP
jgi:uncharacterized protein YijF (DUF1287 family)